MHLKADSGGGTPPSGVMNLQAPGTLPPTADDNVCQVTYLPLRHSVRGAECPLANFLSNLMQCTSK